MIQTFQAHPRMTQLEFGKSLGSSTCTTKKFEWLGIQRAVENKDVSWNSRFFFQ